MEIEEGRKEKAKEKDEEGKKGRGGRGRKNRKRRPHCHRVPTAPSDLKTALLIA
jgi:hypothetical protein